MSKLKIFLALVLADFLFLTGWTVWKMGLPAIFAAAIANPGTILVSIDLCLALALSCGWMIADAKRSNRNPWPFVALTLATGSAGPLAYLVTGTNES